MLPATGAPQNAKNTEMVKAQSENSTQASNGSKKDIQLPRARGVSLTMLIRDRILDPGKGALTMDYLGEKYTADLLETGKILWNGMHFASPSSWAIYVKKQVDPSKKSGCGWNSVKYKGKKLDVYKSMYNKKYKSSPHAANPGQPAGNENIVSAAGLLMRQPVKHSRLKDLIGEVHPNTLVECENFDEISGKMQPFFVTVSSNCLLLINFHCHLTYDEVVGYLGGTWDQGKQCLNIVQAFPCRCRLGDRQNAAATEEHIRLEMQKRELFKVGWYHSHPSRPAEPTLRDIDWQTQYQMKFSTNNPVLALICSPYCEQDNQTAESTVNAFWVAPSIEPSMSPNSCYGTPMKFSYSEIQDTSITQDLNQELQWLVDYYALAPDLINLSKVWKGNMTYLERMKFAVFPKLPKDRNPSYILQLLQKLVATGR